MVCTQDTLYFLRFAYIALNKKSMWVNIFPLVIKMSVVTTHQKHLNEVLPMSTHNICFCKEIRNISGFC